MNFSFIDFYFLEKDKFSLRLKVKNVTKKKNHAIITQDIILGKVKVRDLPLRKNPQKPSVENNWVK
ncbi:MAG: hypothetical protein QJQ54_02575 [Mollicutes bacterium]|nr:MAG: hypothetical protein QJQ54_02575 [Mollicutes bacterium]